MAPTHVKQVVGESSGLLFRPQRGSWNTTTAGDSSNPGRHFSDALRCHGTSKIRRRRPQSGHVGSWTCQVVLLLSLFLILLLSFAHYPYFMLSAGIHPETHHPAPASFPLSLWHGWPHSQAALAPPTRLPRRLRSPYYRLDAPVSHKEHPLPWRRLQQLLHNSGQDSGKSTGTPIPAAACRLAPGAPASHLPFLSSSECAELNALLAFKLSNLDPAGALANWSIPPASTLPSEHAGMSAPPFYCLWSGVNCTGSSVRELAVNNPDRRKCLWGSPKLGSAGQSIPPEVRALTALVSLDLSYNGLCEPNTEPGVSTSIAPLGGLTGSLPSELGQLVLLTYLNLANNMLNGSLPDSLTTLTNLQVLNLQYNLFSGPLPTFLSSLPALNSLSLSSNAFSGPIPPDIGALKSLTNMQLNSLPFVHGTIPDTFSHLPSLLYLSIDSVPLSGSLPSWLTALNNLLSLTIRNTNISGPLPPSLSAASLTSLDLSRNNLSGMLFRGLLSQICSTTPPSPLRYLALAHNSFSGPFPMQLSSCVGLGSIDLGGNQLTGGFPPPPFFRNLSLVDFVVAGNMLTGTVPAGLLSLAPLTLLDVSQNQLTGAMPHVVCGDSSTLDFNFGSNHFTGQLAQLLSPSCASASLSLDASYNQLSGPLPASLSSFSALFSLHLQGNQLSGPLILPSLASDLSSLSLASNSFSGSIPASVFQGYPQLSVLNLSDNLLSGTLPAPVQGDVNSSQQLQQVVVRGNMVQGSIPLGLAELKQLLLLDLSSNNFSLSLPPDLLASLSRLTCLNASHNSLQGPLPPTLATLSLLTALSLSYNLLSGPIPLGINPANLPHLTVLDLSTNELSGGIPADITAFPSTAALNLSFNNLSGPIPSNATGQVPLDPSQLQGNPLLCGGAGYPACPSSSSLSAGVIAGIACGCAVGLVLIGVLAAWFLWRKRDPWSGGALLVFRDYTPPLKVHHLVTNTNSFSDEHCLGRGAFGCVYKATLPDGTLVAVKRLQHGGPHGEKEFKAEVVLLGALKHRNLVQLLAAFVGAPPEGERLLVYEYVAGGSLGSALGKEVAQGSPLRTWSCRRGIAMDIARGLKYMHHECQPPVIHRDIKPGNVLVDDHYVARVADFGLARQADAKDTHQSTGIVGTPGYLAPEYAALRHVSLKSDVYSFGVTLLNIVTGKRPSDRDVAELGFSRWVSTRSWKAAVDPQVDVQEHEQSQVLGALLLGLSCISKIPVDRPSMAEVLLLLENLEELVEKLEQVKAQLKLVGGA